MKQIVTATKITVDNCKFAYNKFYGAIIADDKYLIGKQDYSNDYKFILKTILA